MPDPAPVSSLDEAIAWYETNLQGRYILTADGIRVYCPPGLGRHLATERDEKTGAERFALGRARKMTRIEATIRHGLTCQSRNQPRTKIIAALFVSRDMRRGEDYMVVAQRRRDRLVLTTAFDPRDPDYLERAIAEPQEEPR